MTKDWVVKLAALALLAYAIGMIAGVVWFPDFLNEG